MRNSPKRTPTLCRHKRTGHAYAKFQGRQLWFGRYDDPRTHERFARTLAEWRANGCCLPERGPGSLSVADVIGRYIEFAERYYCRPDGTPTREVANVRDAVRSLLDLYGTLPMEELHIRELKVLREELIDRGLARKTINDRIGRILRIVAWAAEEEYCPPEVLVALKALRPLRRGRTRAKESRRVRPVSREDLERVLALVSKPVAGILELMWHTGMRPGEACQLRPGDIDMSGAVWFYRPASHKTEIHGRDRVIDRGRRVVRRGRTASPRRGSLVREECRHRRCDRRTRWPRHPGRS